MSVYETIYFPLRAFINFLGFNIAMQILLLCVTGVVCVLIYLSGGIISEKHPLIDTINILRKIHLFFIYLTLAIGVIFVLYGFILELIGIIPY